MDRGHVLQICEPLQQAFQRNEDWNNLDASFRIRTTTGLNLLQTDETSGFLVGLPKVNPELWTHHQHLPSMGMIQESWPYWVPSNQRFAPVKEVTDGGERGGKLTSESWKMFWCGDGHQA